MSKLGPSVMKSGWVLLLGHAGGSSMKDHRWSTWIICSGRFLSAADDFPWWWIKHDDAGEESWGWGLHVTVWTYGWYQTDRASIFQSHSVHSPYKYKYSSLGQQHFDKPYAILTYRGTVLKRTNDERHARWGHFQPRDKKWGSYVLN